MKMSRDIPDTGIRDFLNILEINVLQQLALTTTENCVKLENMKTKQEAIEVILKYSDNVDTILNRKIIKKEILFEYLNKNNVNILPPFTKIKLINNCYEFWQKSTEENQKTLTNVSEDFKTGESCKEDIDIVNLMSLKFSEWFYNMLNSDEGVGAEHFWPDAILHIITKDTETNEITIQDSVTDIIQCLNNLKKENHLYFNPNLSADGCKGIRSNHGLVCVFVCGTILNRNNSFGVFEQVFLLISDPFCESNWKIKKTKLILKRLFPKAQHSLVDSEVKTEMFALISES